MTDADEMPDVDEMAALVVRTVATIFHQAGYLPSDPVVGKILRAMLQAHKEAICWHEEMTLQ